MSFMTMIDRLTGPRESIDGDALRDLGLTRSEPNILRFARPEMRQQLEAMARRFGLQPEDLSEDRWQSLDISLACARCKKARSCANFLAEKGDFEIGDCPNSETYAEMAEAKYAAS